MPWITAVGLTGRSTARRVIAVAAAAAMDIAGGLWLLLGAEGTGGAGWALMCLATGSVAVLGGFIETIIFGIAGAAFLAAVPFLPGSMNGAAVSAAYAVLLLMVLTAGRVAGRHLSRFMENARRDRCTVQQLEHVAGYTRQILDTIISGYLIYGSDHFLITDCNNAASVMLGTARTDLIGSDVRTLFGEKERHRLFGPDDRTHHMAEVHLTTGSGAEVDVILSRGQLGSPEEKTAILNILDITTRTRMEVALRESRARYHELFEGLPVGLFRVTANGAILEANRAMTRILGFEDAISLMTTNVADLFDDTGDRLSLMHDVRVTDGHVNREIRMKRKGGGTVWTRVTLHRGGSTGADLDYYDGVLEDISDAKAREEEQRAAAVFREQARRMEAIGNLAGGVAHEFNNILAGMTLRLHIMDAGVEGSDHVREISSLVTRAERVVEGLLAAIGTERDADDIIDIDDAVDEVLSAVLYGTAAHPVIRRIRYGEPLRVHGSRADIVFAVKELVRNAMAASAADEAVEIRTDRRLPDERLHGELPRLDVEYAIVEVEDRGRGIPKADLDRVFEPYFTTHEFGEGRGLGLTRVYGITRGHGGGLYIRSREGEGTTVALFLPEARIGPVSPDG